MLYTSEIRWFQPGKLPGPVETWFTRLFPEADLQEARVDHYFPLPDRKDLGIKLRQGRIELKQRVGPTTAIRLSDYFSGRQSSWRKWGANLTDTEKDTATWIPVTKNRRQVTLHESTTPCALEVSTCRIHDTKWWSICFEAFGTVDKISDSVQQTAKSLFHKHPPPADLQEQQSNGYPALLACICSCE